MASGTTMGTNSRIGLNNILDCLTATCLRDRARRPSDTLRYHQRLKSVMVGVILNTVHLPPLGCRSLDVKDAMEIDKRDKLWEASYDIFYDCYYEEIVSHWLVQFWSVVDDITKWLVALTASSSAVAGWALWNNAGYKELWLMLSMAAGFLSITHSSLGIQSRIKTWSETKKSFVILRMELQSIRQDMAINPDFEIEVMTKRITDVRSKYEDAMSQLGADSFRTSCVERKAQEKLNQTISDQIEVSNGN